MASGPTYFSEAPKYPWAYFPYSSDTSTEESFTGYFGVSNLAPLTRSFGPHSMREQLKTYIESNFEKCADFSAFEKQGLEINKGKPVVDVDMAENDVNFKLTYPLEIENPITKERTALRDFFSKQNIRLKKIHFFIQDLILKDISDVKFDIASKKNFRDSLSVEVIRDFYNKDDIIIVKDEKSLIDTKPFEFVFARHNRNPAMYYTKPTAYTTYPQPNGFEIKEEHLMENYPDDLKALDPDEDVITKNDFTIAPVFPPELKEMPQSLDYNYIDFKISVTDGEKEDYQIVRVTRGKKD